MRTFRMKDDEVTHTKKKISSKRDGRESMMKLTGTKFPEFGSIVEIRYRII